MFTWLDKQSVVSPKCYEKFRCYLPRFHSTIRAVNKKIFIFNFRGNSLINDVNYLKLKFIYIFYGHKHWVPPSEFVWVIFTLLIAGGDKSFSGPSKISGQLKFVLQLQWAFDGVTLNLILYLYTNTTFNLKALSESFYNNIIIIL